MSAYKPKYAVQADDVLQELGKYILADGFEIVYDEIGSHGTYLKDAKTGREYLDFFTCFASTPIGQNHPRCLNRVLWNIWVEFRSINHQTLIYIQSRWQVL